MNDIKFLLEELFTKHATLGKMPTTLQDYEGLYSNKEYETILREVMLGVGLLNKQE